MLLKYAVGEPISPSKNDKSDDIILNIKNLKVKAN